MSFGLKNIGKCRHYFPFQRSTRCQGVLVISMRRMCKKVRSLENGEEKAQYFFTVEGGRYDQGVPDGRVRPANMKHKRKTAITVLMLRKPSMIWTPVPYCVYVYPRDPRLGNQNNVVRSHGRRCISCIVHSRQDNCCPIGH